MEHTSENQKKNKLLIWWKKYYTYIVSCLIIIVVSLIILYVKDCWPFGSKPIMRGDYVKQTWPFTSELKRKILSGESLFYTWNGGFGTNFISNLAYGLCNPLTLILLFVPYRYMLQAGTVLYVVLLLLLNCSMMFYLSHRPNGKELKQNVILMVFSMSYALCTYMVSFMDVWYYLSCAICFPLIMLGMERIVAGKGWKLYVIALALAFISNYYLAGLFCIFIVIYFFSLEFDGWKHFVKKSGQMLVLSALSILSTSVLLLPTMQQLVQTKSMSNSYQGNSWFISIWDEIQYFFAFQRAGFVGSSPTSYGDNNLYFGIFPLMLTGLFFLCSSVPKKVRLKKLAVVLVYLVAFNFSLLNYIMHLGHYPNYYPNRFSIFFILLCIVLASEAWKSLEDSGYKDGMVWKPLVLGIGGFVVTMLCFTFADIVEYQFTYYYTMVIFLIYMVGMLILPLLKNKMKYILTGLSILELCLNITFVLLMKSIPVTESEFSISDEQVELDLSELDGNHGFSRISSGDIFPETNQGLLYGFQDVSLFSSSMIHSENFYMDIGLGRPTNVLTGSGWTIPTASLLNIQYNLINWEETEIGVSDFLFSDSAHLYDSYEFAGQQGEVQIYENESVLSLGYMVPAEAQKVEFPEKTELLQEQLLKDKINEWVSAMGSCGDVLEEVEVQAVEIHAENGQAAYRNGQWIMANNATALKENGVEFTEGLDIMDCSIQSFDSAESTYFELVCETEVSGDYYMESGGILSPVGYCRAGEPFSIYIMLEPEYFAGTGLCVGSLHLYRLDSEEWEQAYDNLSDEQMEVISYDSTHVEGTIHVEESGLFFTSIPYDDNWHMFVDGVETEIIPIWDGTFIAADLPEGEHTITFVYKQKGVIPGFIITVTVIIGLSVCGILEKRKMRKKGTS